MIVPHEAFHSNVEAIARTLGGHRAGSGWLCFCPAHPNENTPALSITDKSGTVLLHCHAGCSQAAVIDALKAKGLWSGHSDFTIDPVAVERARVADEAERKRKIDAARTIWRGCGPITGTPAESYLASRGITLPLPRSLRFNPGLHHPSGVVLPAMVAAVVDAGGNLTGVHRTYLAHDGSGKAAVVPNKAMLGPCSTGAVRLGDWQAGDLLLGEGIETTLSAMQLSGKPGWAALSTAGMKAINLPLAVRDVTLLVDMDASHAGEQAAEACASRLTREGRAVRLAKPPAGCNDWNDAVVALS